MNRKQEIAIEVDQLKQQLREREREREMDYEVVDFDCEF